MARVIPILLLLVLSGCSSDPKSFWRSPSAIVDNIKSLEGRPVSDAINKLGLPQAEQNISGMDILVWYNSNKTITSYGRTFYSADGSLNMAAMSKEFNCVVRGIVSEGKITHIEIMANSVYYCPGQRK